MTKNAGLYLDDVAVSANLIPESAPKITAVDGGSDSISEVTLRDAGKVSLNKATFVSGPVSGKEVFKEANRSVLSSSGTVLVALDSCNDKLLVYGSVLDDHATDDFSRVESAANVIVVAGSPSREPHLKMKCTVEFI